MPTLGTLRQRVRLPVCCHTLLIAGCCNIAVTLLHNVCDSIESIAFTRIYSVIHSYHNLIHRYTSHSTTLPSMHTHNTSYMHTHWHWAIPHNIFLHPWQQACRNHHVHDIVLGRGLPPKRHHLVLRNRRCPPQQAPGQPPARELGLLQLRQSRNRHAGGGFGLVWVDRRHPRHLVSRCDVRYVMFVASLLSVCILVFGPSLVSSLWRKLRLSLSFYKGLCQIWIVVRVAQFYKHTDSLKACE